MLIEPRPTVSPSLPPFNNSFKTWKTAVGYYTDNFNAGNIHIIKSTSGTDLNPIIVPSTAPTPCKPKKHAFIKDRATTSKKGAKTPARPVASGSHHVSASDDKPVASSTAAKTKVIKGKKRAHTRADESDSEGYPPLYDDDDEVVTPSKEVVIDVSDFETPPSISKPRM